MKTIFLATAILTALPMVASAAELIDSRYMTVCSEIKDGAVRLECFDATAKMVAARNTANPENYILRSLKKKADKQD